MRRCFVTLLFALLIATNSKTALADNHVVEVRQINPGGEMQTATCTDNQACHITIGVLSTDRNQPEIISVDIEFWPSGANLKFKAGEETVHLDSGYFLRMDFGKSGRVTKTIFLLRSSSQGGYDPLHRSLVLRSSGNPYAELEIAVSPPSMR